MKIDAGKNEQELLDDLKQGDPKAFEALFCQYWKELYTMAYHRLRDQTFAEDMVQDVFTSLWERKEKIEIHRSAISYLRGALKNRIINWIIRSDIHNEIVDRLLERMNTIEASVIDMMNAKELYKTLDDTITAFPENMRQIFLLRTEEYSVREIAQALGLAEQTVKNNTSEALNRIKQVLETKHPDIHQSFFALLLLLMKI